MKNGYEIGDYFFLLFYIPNKDIFDTELVKMNVDVGMAESMWKKALRLLNSDCPKDSCEWCSNRGENE